AKQNPDAAKAAALQKEVSGLRTELGGQAPRAAAQDEEGAPRDLRQGLRPRVRDGRRPRHGHGSRRRHGPGLRPGHGHGPRPRARGGAYYQ
ncbi:MAG: hypothetical protein MZU91_07775, partial [Desulfosudis oleivorans]|nr:hypothetical protein [Desulfosudis oleivorans]